MIIQVESDCLEFSFSGSGANNFYNSACLRKRLLRERARPDELPELPHEHQHKDKIVAGNELLHHRSHSLLSRVREMN